MMRVSIVTDSTAGLPQSLCQSMEIHVVPLTIHFADATFRDSIDPMEQFYARLASASQAPTTAAPSPGDFHQLYQRLLQQADVVISLHMMGSKSATCEAARVAAALCPPGRVCVVDSQSLSSGLGLLVLEAARWAQAGADAGAILAMLERAIPGTHAYATVRDTVQLKRSGRISLGQAVLANLLSIHPIIWGGRGEMKALASARGFTKALNLMIDRVMTDLGQRPVDLAVMHTNAPGPAEELAARLQGLPRCRERLVLEAGPVLAAHVGAGALGLATMVVA